MIFEFKGKVLKPAGDKLHVFCRQFAKVAKLEETDGVWVCTLEDYAEHAKATVAEFAEYYKGLAAAASEVKEAVDAAKGEGDEKKDEENKEGEDPNKAEGDAM